MKKLNLLIVATALLFTACDYNGQNFPDFDSNRPIDIKTLEYTLTDANYKTIADNQGNKNLAAENGVSAELSALATAKAFSPSLPAQDYVPALLASLYPTADAKSAVRVTYNFKTGSNGYYRLSADDYTKIWDGASTIGSLTPSKSSNTILPELMVEKYPAAKEGDMKFVEYEYSAIEPGQNMSTIDALFDDFEDYAQGTNVAVPTTAGFLINKDVKGARFWECRLFSNNKYAQVTSNGSNAENEVWLITKQIDLTDATDDALFTFDITAGYVNADILSILVSENFDGTEAGIATATWTDISSNFTIPDGPASGYGTLGPAGDMDFKAYAGKNVYIAFKYDGNGIGNVATTTYQIDNVNVSYTAISTVVGEKETRFACLTYADGAWAVDNTKSFYQLTAEDYATMGRTTIAAEDAPKYLPALLQQKYPYAQPGDTKAVVYKISATANNVDEYVYESGAWAPVSFVKAQTGQFIKANNGKWMFDPTINYTLVTSDYKIMVDYIIANKPEFEDQTSTYDNEEFYYGFGNRYTNISFGLSYRTPYLQYDTELSAAATDEEKVEVLWKRMEEGMGIFLQLKFPDTESEVQGIPLHYNVTALVFRPDGTSASGSVYYTWNYEVLTPGAPGVPATFEYVSVDRVQ